MSDAKLTHLDETGAANMVDVSGQGGNSQNCRCHCQCADEAGNSGADPIGQHQEGRCVGDCAHSRYHGSQAHP